MDYDFRLTGEGPMTTVYQLEPLTDAATAWVEAHVDADSGFQPAYPTIYVEHRYLLSVLGGIEVAELTVNTRERIPA